VRPNSFAAPQRVRCFGCVSDGSTFPCLFLAVGKRSSQFQERGLGKPRPPSQGRPLSRLPEVLLLSSFQKPRRLLQPVLLLAQRSPVWERDWELMPLRAARVDNRGGKV